jgi:hypothetical protein
MSLKVALILAALVALSTTSEAGAAAGSHRLRWHSPRKVTSGVPLAVASIQPCPPAPTPGDSTLVAVQLNYFGGATATTLKPNPDGSWAGDVTFYLPGPTPDPVTLTAFCIDFSGHGGNPYSDYGTHRVRVVRSTTPR